MTEEEFNIRFKKVSKELRPEILKTSLLYFLTVISGPILSVQLATNGIVGKTGAIMTMIGPGAIALFWVYKKFKEWKPKYAEIGLACSDCGTVFDLTNKSHILIKKSCPKCKTIAISD